MRRHTPTTMFVCGLTILAAGCEFTSKSETSPISPSQVSITPVLLGTLAVSASADSLSAGSPTAGGTGLPDAGSCSELEFTFDKQNGDVYSGTFRAVCADGIEMTGTATGTYLDGLMTVTATGTASSAGLSCPFTLNGTARLTNDQIVIDYTGTSCLGPVSGSEVLARD
jgi:hypothetical protein